MRSRKRTHIEWHRLHACKEEDGTFDRVEEQARSAEEEVADRAVAVRKRNVLQLRRKY
jgi:hypothetical protein